MRVSPAWKQGIQSLTPGAQALANENDLPRTLGKIQTNQGHATDQLSRVWETGFDVGSRLPVLRLSGRRQVEPGRGGGVPSHRAGGK